MLALVSGTAEKINLSLGTAELKVQKYPPVEAIIHGFVEINAPVESGAIFFRVWFKPKLGCS